jgi:hypothetical protein
MLNDPWLYLGREASLVVVIVPPIVERQIVQVQTSRSGRPAAV